MSAAGALDLRIPIGILFVTLGAIIGIRGALTMDDTELYARSGGININLWWGIVMTVFGAIMLALSRRKKPAAPTQATPEGQAIEDREHRTGLERE